jgi:hypothetical protein
MDTGDGFGTASGCIKRQKSVGRLQGVPPAVSAVVAGKDWLRLLTASIYRLCFCIDCAHCRFGGHEYRIFSGICARKDGLSTAIEN